MLDRYLRGLCYDTDDGGGGGDPPAPIVDHEGNFRDGWTETLPEDIRDEESLKLMTNLPNAVKQFVNAQKSMGKDKITLPGENASPEEKAEFYAKIGRPETPGDYQAGEIPEALGKIYTEDRIKNMQEFAHQIGATQEQFDAYMQYEMSIMQPYLEQQGKTEEERKADAIEACRERFGAAFDERMHVANLAIDEIIGKDQARKFDLLTKYGNDPDFIEFVSDAGAKFVEHKALKAELTQEKPVELKKKMDDLRSTPGYITPLPDGSYLKDTDPARHASITDQIKSLVKQAYPEARETKATVL